MRLGSLLGVLAETYPTWWFVMSWTCLLLDEHNEARRVVNGDAQWICLLLCARLYPGWMSAWLIDSGCTAPSLRVLIGGDLSSINCGLTACAAFGWTMLACSSGFVAWFHSAGWSWAASTFKKGAIVVCHGWAEVVPLLGAIAGCHCSVPWLGGRVTTNLGGWMWGRSGCGAGCHCSVLQLWGSGRGAIGGVDVVPLQVPLQCALVGGEGDDQLWRSGRGAIAVPL